MIETERLYLVPATDGEMLSLIDNETDDEMKKAYVEMYDGAVNNPEIRELFAVWFISLKSGEVVGDMCFKGITEDGTVEVGYGVYPNYEGNGYATEAVGGLISYIAKRSDVKRIEAEALESNLASIKVLSKNGFERNGQTGEEGPRFTLKKDLFEQYKKGL